MGIVSSITNKYQICIDAYRKCAQACDECLVLCLSEPDVAARKNCIGVLIDCAFTCSMASCAMSRDSLLANEFCSLCASVCRRCATECGMFRDDHCAECAAECKSCANECRNMAG